MNDVNTVETAPPATPAVPTTPPAAAVSTALAAGLSSVQQVVPQPAYTFNPERYSEQDQGDLCRSPGFYFDLDIILRIF